VQYVNTIKGLIGNDGLYPSRSELIRVAIKEFLVKELKVAKNFSKSDILSPNNVDTMLSDEEEKSFVNVPTDIVVGNTIVRDFKRYRIISKEDKFQ